MAGKNLGLTTSTRTLRDDAGNIVERSLSVGSGKKFSPDKFYRVFPKMGFIEQGVYKHLRTTVMSSTSSYVGGVFNTTLATYTPPTLLYMKFTQVQIILGNLLDEVSLFIEMYLNGIPMLHYNNNSYQGRPNRNDDPFPFTAWVPENSILNVVLIGDGTQIGGDITVTAWAELYGRDLTND